MAAKTTRREAVDAGRQAEVPAFLVGAFTGLAALAGISLLAVPVLSVGIVRSLPAGTEPVGGGAFAAAGSAAPMAVATAKAADVSSLRFLTAGDAEQGEEHFASYCVACHGPDGKGRPNLGKDLVASKFVRSAKDAELILFLKKGRDVSDPLNTTKVPMPPKGGNPAFTDGQLNDVVAYMRKLQKSAGAPTGRG